MVATIQTKWKHNPGCVDIMAQKQLDRRDRSEPSYEHFSELMSRVSGGPRRPLLTPLHGTAGLYRRSRILPLDKMLILSTPVMVIEYLHLIHVVFFYFSLPYTCVLSVNAHG